MRALLVLFSVAWISLSASADSAVLHVLEETIGRRLTSQERQILDAAAKEFEPPLLIQADFGSDRGSNILFCARANADFFIGGSLGGCVDPSLNRYVVATAGAGVKAGMAVSAFSLFYQSQTGLGVEGTFLGAKAGAAFGKIGGMLGVYIRPDTSRNWLVSDKLYWFGYVAGLGIDVAGSALVIKRI